MGLELDDFQLSDADIAELEASLEPITSKKSKTNKPKTEDSPWTPVVTCMADIVSEKVKWLWPGYIALRKLCLAEGDPSHGKTWLMLAIATAVSRGWPLPDAISGLLTSPEMEPGNVIYMTAEDGLADTIKPRLEMLDADCTKIHVIEGQRQGEKEIEPVTMQDLEILRQAMNQIKPVLLIVDPLQGFLGAGVDMHRANETRPIMAGIMRLAEDFDCAVVIIRHLNKSSGGKAAYRGMGSIDFTAAARTVLLVGKDPEDSRRRIVIPTKCNIGTEGTPIAFTLTESDGYRWAGKVEMTADDLLYPPCDTDESNGDHGRLDDATEFLQDALINGPRLIKEIKKDAKAADIKEITLRRAKDSLQVKAYKEGDAWFWYMPATEENPLKENPMINMINMEQSQVNRDLNHIDHKNPNDHDDQHATNRDMSDDSTMLIKLIKENTLGEKEKKPLNKQDDLWTDIGAYGKGRTD